MTVLNLLADGSWSDFSELVKWFGLPGAMFFVMIIAMARGWVIPGREAEKDKRAAEEQVEDLKARLMKTEEQRDAWMRLAWDNQDQLRTTTSALETAARKMPRARSAGDGTPQREQLP